MTDEELSVNDRLFGKAIACGRISSISTGYKHTPIRDVRISGCKFENASQPDVIENVEGLTFG